MYSGILWDVCHGRKPHVHQFTSPSYAHGHLRGMNEVTIHLLFELQSISKYPKHQICGNFPRTKKHKKTHLQNVTIVLCIVSLSPTARMPLQSFLDSVRVMNKASR